MVRTVASFLMCALYVVLAASVPQAQAPPTTKTNGGATKATGTPAIVNVNTASAAEFEALPGVGPKLAARIIEYRTKNGPFKKIEDLMNVRGLGEKNFVKLKAQLTIGAAKSGERAQP